MRVALLEPPATDPRGPHMAMAALQAALLQDGADVAVYDAGAEGLTWLLRPEHVAASLATVEGMGGMRPNTDQPPQVEFLRRIGRAVVDGVADAVATLRDRERFYDAAACDEARELIGRALELHSAANGIHRYGVAPIRYGVTGIDPAKLADLRQVTARPEVCLFGEYFTELIERVDRHRPDLVGMSILNHQQIIPGLTLARMLRERGHLVVIGGTVYAKFVDQLRARPEFFELFCDAVCPYEGETAIRALSAEAADARRGGRAVRFEGIPNLLWLDQASRRVQAGPIHLEDVARLPTPCYDGFALENYLVPRLVLPILTGKGCYFNKCRFCDIPYINRVAPQPYRRRRPEKVAADLAQLWHRHDAQHFVITDEALSPRFLLQIAEALDDYPDVEPRLAGYARFEAGFTLDTCTRLHRAGLRRVFFGLESGSQRMLDHMVKGIQVRVAHDVVRNCAAAGIGFHLFSIVGLPEETAEDAEQTLNFFLDAADVIDHPRNTLDIHRFSLDLRTDYFDNADRFGIVVDRDEMAKVDFPLEAPAWHATRGLSATQADTLIAEFSGRLRARLARSRVFPSHIYPSFEEYSILYADQFDSENDTWSLRFALPDAADPVACTLSWCERLCITPIEGGVLLSGMTGERPLSRAAFELLHPAPSPAPAGELLATLLGRLGIAVGSERHDRIAVELRSIVDDLLAVGILHLDVEAVARDPAVSVR
jgi:hypothetical protein